MASRILPPSPDLDHLRNQAKALMRAYEAGDADATARIDAVVAPDAPVRLADAQRAIAREYGFPSWPKLKRHVETSRGVAAAVDAFMKAVEHGRIDAAREIAEREPRIASASVRIAAMLGREEEVRRIIAENPERVHERTPGLAATPLLAVCFSPFHGESAERDEALFRTAQALLDAGADPNGATTVYDGSGDFGIPCLYGVTGEREVPRIARMLLEAGARPDDGESLFHAAQKFHGTSLDLLLEYGVDVNATGTWGNTALYFLLDHFDDAADANVRAGIDWLLAQGADANMLCGRKRETPLHVAARRGRSVETVRRLLEHGADVHIARGDGCTAWRLAFRTGNEALVALLESAGARRETLEAVDELLAACARGEAANARALASPALLASLTEDDLRRLPDAANKGRIDVVRACLAAGFPINHEGEFGGAALHHACLRGRSDMVREILHYGPDLALRDRAHEGSALGWTAFAADMMREPGGDYAGCVRLLLAAGAKPLPTDHVPADRELAALLGPAEP